MDTLRTVGIVVLRGIVMRAGDNVRAAHRALGGGMVKAQALHGWRGKHGGVDCCMRRMCWYDRITCMELRDKRHTYDLSSVLATHPS
ncbi:MAG: hypothetical protein Q7T01_01100 [bacterium]|nr:hypothetical protein [bacterium]